MTRRKTSHGHYLGWRRDTTQHNRAFYSAPQHIMSNLPSMVDLEPNMPAVYDQESIGSCTANAIAAAIEYERLAAGQPPDFIPSRLFIYYNERAVEGDTGSDAGAAIGDGMNSITYTGVCPESEWPYVATPADISGNFPVGSAPSTMPPAACYTSALKYRATSTLLVMQNLTQLRACLAQRFPFVFGFIVYDNIYGADGNPVTYLTLPGANDREEGGHAVLCVGYDDSTHLFKIRNSWGASVMQHGYFFMPYSYMLQPNLANSFATVRKESQ